MNYLFFILLSIFLLPLLQTFLQSISLNEKNYQGEKILTGFGLYILPHIFLYYHHIPTKALLFFFLVTLGGFLDDLDGDYSKKGLKGHVHYFLKERLLSTGLIKVLFTGLGAIYLLLPFYPLFFFHLLFLLLSTNSLNLLDLRPGRAFKVFFLLFFPLLFLKILPGSFWYLLLPLSLSLLFELKERVMLGDSGSNLLGAFLGFLYLSYLPFFLLLLLFLVFLSLTLFCERYSLSLFIESNLILKRFDLLGRKR